MSWIATTAAIDDETWDGDLNEMQGRIADPKTGRFDHVMAIHSLYPKSLASRDTRSPSAMSGTEKPRKVDRVVLDIAEVTAPSAGVDDGTNGQGVKLEPWPSDD